MQEIGELLAIAIETVATNDLNLKVEGKDLAYCAVKALFESDDGDMLIEEWKMDDMAKSAIILMYKKHLELLGMNSFKDRMNLNAWALVERMKNVLSTVITSITLNLWDHHQNMDRKRKMKAKMKATKAKRALKKKTKKCKLELRRKKRKRVRQPSVEK